MIHVMAAAGLGRAAVTAPVMGDHAKALAQEEEHLRVPIVRRKRPAMAKHDRLTRAPILVEDLCAVLGRDSWHDLILSSAAGWIPREREKAPWAIVSNLSKSTGKSAAARMAARCPCCNGGVRIGQLPFWPPNKGLLPARTGQHRSHRHAQGRAA